MYLNTKQIDDAIFSESCQNIKPYILKNSAQYKLYLSLSLSIASVNILINKIE